MRQLSPRKPLSAPMSKRLQGETERIEKALHPVAQASTSYENARSAKWFAPVVKRLQEMAGPGQRCMVCSASEAAQIEHYRPKSKYPLKAFEWDNLLWICGVCNVFKRERFTESTPPVDPCVDQVWKYFFIDEYGNLCATWDSDADAPHMRAEETIAIYRLDRQAVQDSRQARLKELRSRASELLQLFSQGSKSPTDLRDKLTEFRSSPMQPDVADFFLNGPGRSWPEFKALIAAADQN
jgi:uncharacterized protein (TIGR02646 family)